MAIVTAIANELIDDSGKTWLDLQSGILNTPFGHGSVLVNTALDEIMTTGLINTYDRPSFRQEELLELMTEYAVAYMWKPFNTGAEAIDKAIQVAATYFNKVPRIAVLRNSFHGKLLSMAWAHYGDDLPWRNPMNLITINPNEECPDFDVLIYEPIQGWDGTINEEMHLRELCNDRGALLIADEMITGFMRCGKRFMSETADIIVCGKGISAGVPLALLGFSHKLLVSTIPTGWRSTGAGNNLSMTIGALSLKELIENEGKIKDIVQKIQERLHGMGFYATGALGFKPLRNHEIAKMHFEQRHVVASWHCPPQVRVGPSFATTSDDLDKLENTLREVDEL